jgi:hypothetical protein
MVGSRGSIQKVAETIMTPLSQFIAPQQERDKLAGRKSALARKNEVVDERTSSGNKNGG